MCTIHSYLTKDSNHNIYQPLQIFLARPGATLLMNLAVFATFGASPDSRPNLSPSLEETILSPQVRVCGSMSLSPVMGVSPSPGLHSNSILRRSASPDSSKLLFTTCDFTP